MRKAQTSPAYTQLIQEVVRSWVKGKRAWSSSGERRKTYYGVPAKTLLGEMSCWDDILPKISKDELKPLGACHEG